MVAKKKTTQTKKEDIHISKSVIPNKDAMTKDILEKKLTEKPDKEKVDNVRVLFQGKCPKLTPRGVGNIAYEIGINDTTDEAFLRIAANESSGVFSNVWIGVNDIRKILEKEKGQSFRPIVLRDLYLKLSSNNHGFLAAILKAEGVLVSSSDQPTVMEFESMESLSKKIKSFK